MLRNDQIPDKSLLQTVNRRMQRTGTGSQMRLTATVQRGTVTLSGTLQYERQRSPIMKAVSNVAGVRNVVDQLRVGEGRKV